MAGSEADTRRFGASLPQLRKWALALGLLIALLPLGRAHATNDPGSEERFTELVAQERSRAGVGPLAGASDLVVVAREHAARMADEGRLYHNARLGDEVTGWQALGENVGRGRAVDQIHTAFMESPSHRANILDARFTQIGLGVVVRDGEMWVVEVFRQPAAGAPRSPPPRDPAPRPVAAAAAAPAATPPVPAASTPVAPTASAAPAPTAAEASPAAPPLPVANLSEAPATRRAAGTEVLGDQALSVPLPGIPPATKLAASLLVAVVAAQVVTLRRLRLV